MAQADRWGRGGWAARRDEPDALPDFLDDLGPARSPLQELRDYAFFLPDEADEAGVAAPPAPPPNARPRARVAWHDGVLDGPALVLVLLFFGGGGAALLATGFLLGGVAGATLAGIGYLIALAVGAATRGALVAESAQPA